MAEKFKLCILFEEKSGRDLSKIAPGWEMAKDPDYCLHVHIAGEHGQPGVGDLDDVFIRLFRILRDMGYTRSVSAACPWVSTDGGPVDFSKENAKSLAYLKAVRDKVYAE